MTTALLVYLGVSVVVSLAVGWFIREAGEGVRLVCYWRARGLNAAAATVCTFMGGEEQHASKLLAVAGEACL